MQKRDLDMHNHNLWRNVTHLDLDAIVLQSYSISGMFWVMSGPFLLEIDLAQCKYISSLVWHWWLALKAVPPESLHPCNDLRSEPPHLPVHSGPHPAIHNHRYTNSFQAVWSMSSCLSLATQAASDVFETFWNLDAVRIAALYVYIYICIHLQYIIIHISIRDRTPKSFHQVLPAHLPHLPWPCGHSVQVFASEWINNITEELLSLSLLV